MRISLAQVTASRDPQENLVTVEKQIGAAVAAGSQLVVFPEAMMKSFDGPIVDAAEPLDGPWATAVRNMARDAGVTVIVGMFTPADNGRACNTVLITGPGVDASYNKIHVFDAFGFAESDTVAPGSDPLVVDIGGVGVGVATCYDIRFPGLFQTLADRGALVTLVPASWGRGPGKVDQWTLLARARALDSTVFIAACDQADPETSGCQVRGKAPLGVGHSLVVGPNGVVLDSLGDGPGLLTVDIDVDQVVAVRKTLPVLANRRF